MATEKVKIVFEAEGKKALDALKKVNAGLKNTETNSGKTSSALKFLRSSWLLVAAAVTGAALAMGKAVSDASDLEEATAKFSVVFRGVEDSAESMRDTLTRSFGMSKLEATEALSGFQDFLVPMGIARDEAAKLSGAFTTLAVDIGSFNNQPTAQVVEDIKSAMAGMSRPLRKYGIDVSDTTLKNMAMARGISLVNGKLDRQTRAMLIHEKITMDSADAMGDFQRTQEGFANTMKTFKARMADLSVAFGKVLLPVAQKIVAVLTKVAEAINWAIDSSRAYDKQLEANSKVLAKWNLQGEETAQLIRETVQAYQGWKEEIAAVKGFTEQETAVRKEANEAWVDWEQGLQDMGITLEQAIKINKQLTAAENGGTVAVTKNATAIKKRTAVRKKTAEERKKEDELETKRLAKQDRERAQSFATWQSFMAQAQSSKVRAIWAIGKAAAISETIQNTHAAAMGAYKSMSPIPFIGPVLGGIAAAAAIAYGAERVSAISASPPPKAEHGAYIPGSSVGTTVTAGEKGKSEAIIPLEDSPLAGGMGTNINFYGDVYGFDDFKDKVDQALYIAKQDDDSRLADSIITDVT